MKKRVVVAMSGGVDSSVAAALLKEQGYDVIGVTMQIWASNRDAGEVERFGGCCSISAVEDARQVAQRLDIPYYVLNFRDIFAEKVIENFIDEYRHGRTPNPCIRCNQFVKFEVLLQKAIGLGADFIATGHYARIEQSGPAGEFVLKKGLDPRKDQSYALYTMSRQQLARTLMPIGGLTKDETRALARKIELCVHEKAESQEICFVTDDNYGRFLEEEGGMIGQPGPVIDTTGRLLGRHKGLFHYTIGQRRGLGIAAGSRVYVVDIDTGANTLIVGPKEAGLRSRLVAGDLLWTSSQRPEKRLSLKARIRYNMQEAACDIEPIADDLMQVRFHEPQWAISPGQSVVFYDEDRVLGGGIIRKTPLGQDYK